MEAGSAYGFGLARIIHVNWEKRRNACVAMNL